MGAEYAESDPALRQRRPFPGASAERTFRVARAGVRRVTGGERQRPLWIDRQSEDGGRASLDLNHVEGAEVVAMSDPVDSSIEWALSCAP